MTQSAVAALRVGADYSGTFRNKIINGDMRIDQRNAGASFTPTDQTLALDRWKFRVSQASKYTVQQVADGPSGYVNSMKITSSSAYPVVTGDYFAFNQRIEGYNVADLDFGLATARTVTLSFWVKSSLTGVFGGVLQNGAETRSYGFTYTITSANVWQYVTVTIPGDTSGTWIKDNGIGLYVTFNLGTGSTYGSATSNTWAAQATQFTPSGTVSVVGTNAATWQITGVQLESGSSATAFERRPYGIELGMCQRYFIIYGSVGSTGTQGDIFPGFYRNSSSVFMPIQYPVMMRTTPSFTFISASGAQFSSQTQDTTVSSFSLSNTPTPRSAFVYANSSAAFAAGNGIVYSNTGSTTNSFSFSAEL